jgi:hypothetical protein
LQYVLTKGELKKLVPAAEHEKLKRAIEWMRKTLVANRCIHTGNYTYCSSCPLGALDDSGPPEELRDIVCTHSKSYPK